MKKTLWETENRNFQGDLKVGKEGEREIARLFSSYKNVAEVRDISKSTRGIDDDIDLEVVYTDGHITTLEVKTDLMAHRTGNLAYEEFSHNNPGCFARTKADYLAYLLNETGKVFIISADEFRTFIKEMKEDEEKARSLRVRPSRMGQGASGYLVPIKSAREAGIITCEMSLARRAA